MSWSARTARRVPRAAARTTALVSVLAATAVVAGTASAAGGHPARPGQAQAVAATLAYGCRFPSGLRPVTVTVSADLPRMAQAGRPIRPAGARLTVAFPRAAASDLARLHSATVSAATRLTIDASEGSAGTSVVWPGATRHAAPVPARAGLVLRASGPVPPVTPAGQGEAVFMAAGLSLRLTPGAANITPIPSPAPVTTGGTSRGSVPTPPPAAGTALQVTCILARGQQAVLAIVPVTGAVARRARHSATSSPCPPQPPGGLQLNPKFPLPKHPKGAKVTFPTPVPGCAWVEGYSNVRKLKGSALVGPGKTDINLPVREVIKSPKYFEEDAAAELEFKPCPTCKIVHGLPPAHTTFLGFGFVPVSATLQLTEVGTTNVYAIGGAFSLITNQVFSEVKLRVFDVKVNGVPLDVGPQCESAHPILLTLTGNPNGKPPYTIQNGGPLTGTITIPPFKHCGVGEDLDPLFTASISGPGNVVILTQGSLCTLQNPPFGCPPKKPHPVVRKVTE